VTLAPATLTLLLPAETRLRGALAGSSALARLLARADATLGAPGTDAQLLRHFDLLPRRVPVAPITRALDADDAGHGAWMRADPAYVRADMATGRMLACGELGLDADACDQLLRPLRPLFGDEGFPISAPVPQRWYLSLPRDVDLPELASPDDALGDDLHPHLPAGAVGRRWRRLLNEAQVVLHNHPLNDARVAAGQPPVNSLWFWGAGVLPDRVALAHRSVHSDDPLLLGLGRLAERPVRPLQSLLEAAPELPALIDLRRLVDVAQLQAPWLPWALQQQSDVLRFDFADGRVFDYRARHRWRVWRRSLPAPA
jgi:hypothetical protein